MILADVQRGWSRCTFFRALAFTPKCKQAMAIMEGAIKSVNELRKMVSSCHSCHVVSCRVWEFVLRWWLVRGAGQCRGGAGASPQRQRRGAAAAALRRHWPSAAGPSATISRSVTPVTQSHNHSE